MRCLLLSSGVLLSTSKSGDLRTMGGNTFVQGAEYRISADPGKRVGGVSFDSLDRSVPERKGSRKCTSVFFLSCSVPRLS